MLATNASTHSRCTNLNIQSTISYINGSSDEAIFTSVLKNPEGYDDKPAELLVIVCRKCIKILKDGSHQGEEISLSQDIANFGREFNCLATGNDDTIVIYTSSGNFHVYKLRGELQHFASYINQNDAISDLLAQEKKNAIGFENDKLREVSAMKIFNSMLIVTYWDSDQNNSKCIEFLNVENLNEIVCKYYFNTKNLIFKDSEMDIDSERNSKENTSSSYRNYLYSIVSIEVVKYHHDHYYLICGADNGYLYTFSFNPSALQQKQDDDMRVDGDLSNSEVLFNMRNIALGNSPIYLYKMKHSNFISNLEANEGEESNNQTEEHENQTKDRDAIFALSNTSWVIYPCNDKLQYSPLSIPSITNFCNVFINNKNLNLCILSTVNSLVIGSIKKLSKLQKQSYIFDFNITKIEYIKEMNIYIYIGLFDSYSDERSFENSESKIVLFDLLGPSSQNCTKSLLNSIQLKKNEYAITFTLRKVNHHIFVYVLTADLDSIEDGKYEKRGRII